MPLNIKERTFFARETQHSQDIYNEQKVLEDLMDQEEDKDDEEANDEEPEDEGIEFAYQSDFKKRNPPNTPCQHTSLLSSLLSLTGDTVSNGQKCTSPTNSREYYHHISSKPSIRISNTGSTAATASDPLSESLKRNLEWEHAQSSLRKYEKIKRSSGSSGSLTDNFSRW